MFDATIERALDALDSLKPFDRERVEYAAEQLLNGNREDGDTRIFVEVITQATRKPTLNV